MPTRIAVVAPTNKVAESVSEFLGRERGFELIGARGSLDSIDSFVAQLHPDVLVICDGDKSAPVHHMVSQVQATDPRVKCLLMGSFDDNSGILTMLRLGVAGILPVDAITAEIVSAIEEVSRGHLYISPQAKSITGAADSAPARIGAPTALSRREEEVLTLVTDGLSTREIADRLAIGVKTVETHRSNIMKKLGIRSVARLTKYAIRNGLTRLDS